MSSKFRPMRGTEIDRDNPPLPGLISPKLDGVRALIQNGQVLSKSLKPIANQHIQALLSKQPVLEGLDGELLIGPHDEEVYRRTASIVNSKDKPIDGLMFWVFDDFNLPEEPFSKRAHAAQWHVHRAKVECGLPVEFVVPKPVQSKDELEAYHKAYLDLGFEGSMYRKADAPYKFGKVTQKQGYLLKVKDFCDAEAEILGCEEMLHNNNAAVENELGYTSRSTHKGNKEGADVLGAFSVRDLTTGVEFRIGTGFTAAERAELWSRREQLIGQLVKYKYFPQGGKAAPRFPTFLGFRSKEDM